MPLTFARFASRGLARPCAAPGAALARRRPRFVRPSIGAALAAVALAAAILGGCTPAAAPATPVPTASPGVPATLPAEVSPAVALALREKGAFVLDVRQPEEWAAGHIPDATLIPVWDLAGRLAEVPRDREVVVVCRSGNRSAQGRDILLKAGFRSVTSMAGGMTDWSAAGYPTTAGG